MAVPRLDRVSPVAVCLVSSALAAVPPPGTPKAFDWTATGADCMVYAGVDFNHDGFDDLLCVNSENRLWLSVSVNGWKAAGWSVVREPGPDKIIDIFGHCESARLAKGELALVFADRMEVVTGTGDGKATTVRTEHLPDAARFEPAEVGARSTGEPAAWPASVLELLPSRLRGDTSERAWKEFLPA